MAYLGVEGLTRKCVYGESGFLSDHQTAYIALINRRLDLHIAQVLGDDEQLGRLQAAGHGLAALNGALDHNARDWRGDARAPQIDTGLGEGRFALRHRGLRLLHLRLRHTHLRLHRFQRLGIGAGQSADPLALGLRHKLLVHQALGARIVALRLAQIHLCARHLGLRRERIGLRCQHSGLRRLQIGLRGAHPEVKGLRVDLRQQLPGLHFVVEIDQHIADLPADLRAHGDQRHRIDRAGCRHHRLQIPPRNRRAAVFHTRSCAPVPPADCQSHCQQQQAACPLNFLHAGIVGRGYDPRLKSLDDCPLSRKNPRNLQTQQLFAPGD